MPINQTQIDTYNILQVEKAELEAELQRIDGFLNRGHGNEDNARGIKNGKVFCKFAGTAVWLPTGIFNGAINARRAEVIQRLSAIDTELNAL